MFSCKGRRKSLRNCGRGMAIRMQPGARRGACLHDHARGRQGQRGGTAELCRGRSRPLSRRARRAPRPEPFPGEGRGAARRGPGLAAETRPLGRAARRPASGRDRPRAAGARPIPTPRAFLPPLPGRRRVSAAACTGAVWAPPGRAPPPNDTPSANVTAGPAAPAGRTVGRRAADCPPPRRRSRPREKGAELPPRAPRIARAGPLQGGITRPCFQQTP